jgi:NADH-quinone oxidoreductase subunit N
MMLPGISPMMIAILPEIALLVLAILVLTIDMLRRSKSGQLLGKVTIVGIGVILVLSALFSRPGIQPVLIWGGMLRVDAAGYVFRMLFILGASLTTLFLMDNHDLDQQGEFFSLMLVSTIGMCLLASSADLIMVYLAFELVSIPMYVLAGSLIKSAKSVEAGIKYILFGALTSSIMLYGFSLLYGLTGTTNLYKLAELLQTGQLSYIIITATAILVLVGFGFKVSAVPFHFWAPDVYEGAPTQIAGFLSTASKAAGFAILLRVLFVVYPNYAQGWSMLVAILAVASMVIGNLQALAQTNIKRLLAYSSIAQAGYMLVGVAAGTTQGMTATIYYLIVYLFTNLAAFGLVMVSSNALGSEEISAYAGLSRRSPGLALGFLAALLSLGGIPPFAGFTAKFLVFGAAVDANMAWLAVVGVIASIVALYYYLKILKVIYLDRSPENEAPIHLTLSWKVGLGITFVGILLSGIIISPWYVMSAQAASAFLGY